MANTPFNDFTDPLYAKPASVTSRWFHDNVYDPNPKALRVVMDSPFAPDVIFTEGEFADPLDRLGLLVGGVETGTDLFHAFTFNSDGRLRVDAEVNLSMSELAVEVDATDGDSIGLFGYINGDYSFPIPLNSTADGILKITTINLGDHTSVYDESNLPNGEQVLLSYVVPLAQKYFIEKISCSGDCDALIKIKLNSNTIEARRNSWTNRNVDFFFAKGLITQAGDIIEVTVNHSELTPFLFNATLYGEQTA